MKYRFTRRAMRVAGCVLATSLVLSGCGSDTESVELPKITASLLKSSGKQLGKKLGGGKDAKPNATTPAAADPNAIVAKALSATKGPIALVVRIETKAVLAISPVGRNGDYVTWGSAPGQGLTFQRGVLANTRGLGEDLMASRIDTAVSAITGRRSATYKREHTYLGNLGQSTSLIVECALSRGKTERVSLGAINADAVIMKESCKRGEIAFNNLYWVDGNGRVLKSSQWVGQRIGSLAIQNLRL
ncbi:YjbF family lipoprotein [Aliiroseovarius sp. F47248L]|uniref:YjbF family lipoprotein n=1 Tax=Aliiroseovarius sp. F47248L TaxID=2926420 RepID=UPI001FF2692C|nr:YjbF family lipoprotein [Aliiroseovarius sp. F47248L]